MRSELKNLLFLAIFGFLCTVFVLFVPFGDQSNDEESVNKEENLDVSTGVVQDSFVFSGSFHVTIFSGINLEKFIGFTKDFVNEKGGEIEVSISDLFSAGSGYLQSDLLVIPYDFLSFVDSEEVHFQENISSLFIPQFSGNIDFIKFFPLAMDPAGYFTSSDCVEGLDNLYSYANNWRSQHKVSPFNFGYFSGEIFSNQNILVAHVLRNFIRFNDVGALQSWVDISFTTDSMKEKLLQIIQGNHDSCAENLLYCMLKKDIIGIIWDFYSSSSSFQDTQLKFFLYPYQYIGYPVRIFGLVVPKKSQNKELARRLLVSYLERAFSSQEESLLDNSGMLPVFFNEFQKTCLSSICDKMTDIYVLNDSFGEVMKLKDDKLFDKVIERKFQSDLYLRRTSL